MHDLSISLAADLLDELARARKPADQVVLAFRDSGRRLLSADHARVLTASFAGVAEVLERSAAIGVDLAVLAAKTTAGIEYVDVLTRWVRQARNLYPEIARPSERHDLAAALQRLARAAGITN